jgi:hypothetical protein
LITSCSASTKVAISKKFDRQTTRIAVVQFMSTGAKSGYDPYISDKISAALVEKGFSVAERQKVEDAASESRLSLGDVLSKRDLTKISQLTGVDVICFGSVGYKMDYRSLKPEAITVRCVDLKSGDVVFNAECRNEDWDGTMCVKSISAALHNAMK